MKGIKLFSYLILILSIGLFSCKKEQEVKKLQTKRVFPERSVINGDIIFRDSGIVIANLRAPLIEEYNLTDSSYISFPRGIEIDYFKDSSNLKANWAKMNRTTGLYEGRGNVILINDKGDSLKTELLYWDNTKQRIYTNKIVYIISATGDSLKAANGMEADSKLTNYTFYNNSGVKQIDKVEH